MRSLEFSVKAYLAKRFSDLPKDLLLYQDPDYLVPLHSHKWPSVAQSSSSSEKWFPKRNSSKNVWKSELHYFIINKNDFSCHRYWFWILPEKGLVILALLSLEEKTSAFFMRFIYKVFFLILFALLATVFLSFTYLSEDESRTLCKLVFDYTYTA